MTTSSSDDPINRRLLAVAKRPENQLCCDCGDHKPTWASIIVPPPGVSDEESRVPIGAFCCFHCSGAHRRLGVHICFVRSITLDEWKEKEVTAMEMGGNKRVNMAFEARLSTRRAAAEKPNSQSDLELRDRFIKAKYQDRKFFDSAKYATEKEKDKPTSIAQPPAPADAFAGISLEDLFSVSQTGHIQMPSEMESTSVEIETSSISHSNPECAASHKEVFGKMKHRESSGVTEGRRENLEDPIKKETGINNDETKEPEYFLPLKDYRAQEGEASVNQQGKDQSSSSRKSTPSQSPDRVRKSSSQERVRRSHRSCSSPKKETLENTERSRPSMSSKSPKSSKSPMRSSSLSRRAHSKGKRSMRRGDSGHEDLETDPSTYRIGSDAPIQKHDRVSSSRMRRSGSTMSIEKDHAPLPNRLRRNVSGPSLVDIKTRKSGSGIDLSLLSHSKRSGMIRSKHSSMGSLGTPHHDTVSSQNATFTVPQQRESTRALDDVISNQTPPTRFTSEYILQELAKINLSTQTSMDKGSLSSRSSHGRKSGTTNRSSEGRSPMRGSGMRRRPLSRQCSSEEAEPVGEGTSSKRKSSRQSSQSEDIDRRTVSAVPLDPPDEKQNDLLNSNNGGLFTRVASKFALEEFEEILDKQKSAAVASGSQSRSGLVSNFKDDEELMQKRRSHSNRRSRSRRVTSRSTSTSPSRQSRTNLSLSRSPSTRPSHRRSCSRSSSNDSGSSSPETAQLESDNSKHVSGSRSHSGRNSAHDRETGGPGSTARLTFRQNSGNELDVDRKSVNPTISLSLPANVKKKLSDTQNVTRLLSHKLTSADDKPVDERNPIMSDSQQLPSTSTANSSRTTRRRHDPLASRSDHQARSRGRISSRVDAANQKAASAQLSSTVPAAPSKARFFSRTASMSRLDDEDSLNSAGAPSPSTIPVAPPKAGLFLRTTSVPPLDDTDRLGSATDRLSSASCHGVRPRSSRLTDKDGLGSGSSHGLHPRYVRNKSTGNKSTLGSGNERVLQLFATGSKEEIPSPTTDDCEGSVSRSSEETLPTRKAKKLSAAALKAMQELKEITG